MGHKTTSDVIPEILVYRQGFLTIFGIRNLHSGQQRNLILRGGFQDGEEDPSHHLAKRKIRFLLLSYSDRFSNGSVKSRSKREQGLVQRCCGAWVMCGF